MRRAFAVSVLAAAAFALAYAVGSGLLDPMREGPMGDRAPVSGGGEGTAGGVRSAIEPFVPRELVPPAPAGEELLVELIDEPAARYGRGPATESDRVYAGVLAGLRRPDAAYDPGLARAARDLAYQHSVAGTLLPHDVVEFLLRSAGAIDRSVTQGYTRTGGEGMEAVRKRLEQMLASEPPGDPIQVGVGEAYVPGATQPRYIAILLGRRLLDVSPAPRRLEPSGRWVLSGSLPAGYDEASALVGRPDGQMEEVEVAVAGRRFSLTVPMGGLSGVHDVSLGARGPFGHTPLLQVPVYAGVPLPTSYGAHMPPDESAIRSVDAAEKRALELLNEDRDRFGLPALLLDAALSRIARAHSLDMRDGGFFGHVSPDTGSPGDRLAAAGYRAGAQAENVALGSSVHGAQAGLMHSLGHRRNILSPSFTHVGIGVSASSDGERIQWRLTQLFASPVSRVDREVEREHLRKRVAAARQVRGLASLASDAALDTVAQRHAPAVAAGGATDTGGAVMDDAKKAGLARGGAYVFLSSTTDVRGLPLPQQATSASYTRLGVGVEQLEDHPNGLVGVVLLFTGEP